MPYSQLIPNRNATIDSLAADTPSHSRPDFAGVEWRPYNISFVLIKKIRLQFRFNLFSLLFSFKTVFFIIALSCKIDFLFFRNMFPLLVLVLNANKQTPKA
jgi:hypothetical protein